MKRGQRCPPVGELAVVVVFDDHRAGARGPGEQSRAGSGIQSRSEGVVMVRGDDEGVQIGAGLDGVEIETVVEAHRERHRLDPQPVQDPTNARVSRVLDAHAEGATDVPGREREQRQQHRIARPRGHDDLVGNHVEPAGASEMPGDLVAQKRIAPHVVDIGCRIDASRPPPRRAPGGVGDARGVRTPGAQVDEGGSRRRRGPGAPLDRAGRRADDLGDDGRAPGARHQVALPREDLVGGHRCPPRDPEIGGEHARRGDRLSPAGASGQDRRAQVVRELLVQGHGRFAIQDAGGDHVSDSVTGPRECGKSGL